MIKIGIVATIVGMVVQVGHPGVAGTWPGLVVL